MAIANCNFQRIKHQNIYRWKLCRNLPKLTKNNVYAIGNYQGGGQRFAKYLDDFRVYGVTLSANEVSQIYSNGHGDLNANYNSFFTMESNGTLKTAVPFDFRNKCYKLSNNGAGD